MLDIKFRPPSPTLREFWRSDAFLQFVMGPVGSAKTSTCIWKCLKVMMAQEPNARGERLSRGAVIRNTRSDLKSTTIPDWRSAMGDEFGDFAWGPPPEHKLRFAMPDGTRVVCDVLFLGLDHEDDVRKIRGANWTWAYLNEMKELNAAVLRMVRSRLNRFPSREKGGAEPTWGGVIADYNAPDEDHWLYRMVEEDRPDNLAFFRQPPAIIKQGNAWTVNPDADNLRNLKPTGEQYYLNQIGGNPEDWLKVNLGNEYGYVQDGRPVYPEYADSTHCREFDVDPDLPLLLGWDFGLTPAVIIAQESRRGQLRIVDELCADDMGVYQFARDVVKPHLLKRYGRVPLAEGGHRMLDVDLSWAEPAKTRVETDASTSIALLNDSVPDSGREDLDLGFITEAATTNDPTRRQDAVRSYLTRMIDGAPAFLLHPRCKVLRAGFNGKYSYRRLKVVGDERFKDTPEKNAWSHPHDALQYLALAAQGGYATPDRNDDYYERTVSTSTGY